MQFPDAAVLVVPDLNSRNGEKIELVFSVEFHSVSENCLCE